MKTLINWLFQPITVGSCVVKDGKLGIVTDLDDSAKVAFVNWKADQWGSLDSNTMVAINTLTLVDHDAVNRVRRGRGEFKDTKLRTRKIDTVIDRTQLL